MRWIALILLVPLTALCGVLRTGVPVKEAQVSLAPVTVHANAPQPSAASLPPALLAGFVPVVDGGYTMSDKFHLFRSIGATTTEATLLSAICTAENRGGNPVAVNTNKNAPPDDGLCQVNEMHAAMAGGAQNLFVPQINAEVALELLRQGGPKLWCTYPGGCNGQPGVPDFFSLLAQAQAIAQGDQ